MCQNFSSVILLDDHYNDEVGIQFFVFKAENLLKRRVKQKKSESKAVEGLLVGGDADSRGSDLVIIFQWMVKRKK